MIEIPVRLNKEFLITLVDECDSDLALYKWCGRINSAGQVYARRRVKGVFINMNRVILARILNRGLTEDEYADHKNTNSLDNTRNNIRLATKAQNCQNAKLRKDSKSGYKGVYWHSQSNRWRASIQSNGKRYTKGGFITPELAFEAYKKLAIEFHGEFARFE